MRAVAGTSEPARTAARPKGVSSRSTLSPSTARETSRGVSAAFSMSRATVAAPACSTIRTDKTPSSPVTAAAADVAATAASPAIKTPSETNPTGRRGRLRPAPPCRLCCFDPTCALLLERSTRRCSSPTQRPSSSRGSAQDASGDQADSHRILMFGFSGSLISDDFGRSYSCEHAVAASCSGRRQRALSANWRTLLAALRSKSGPVEPRGDGGVKDAAQRRGDDDGGPARDCTSPGIHVAPTSTT